MRTPRQRALLGGVVLLAVAGCADEEPGAAVTTAEVAVTSTTVAPATTTTAPATTLPATGWSVADIVDGDTLEISGPAGRHRLRLIGIDAPEQGACFADAATNALRFMAPPGTPLTLVSDTSDTDEYDRLLRYVQVTTGDGTVLDVGGELVVQGFAAAREYPPDTARGEDYAARELWARTLGAGMWAPDVCPPATGEPATSEPVAPAPLAPAATAPIVPLVTQPAMRPAVGLGGPCDPSYPDVCIPPGPPDLECSQIEFRRFRVIQADPHGFDRDDDGIGCEGE